MGNRNWILAGFGAAGLLLAACGGTGGGSSHPASPAAGGGASAGVAKLSTGQASVGTVLANAQGRTLYWFAIDTPAASRCTGACTSAWPPVMGSPRLGPGVSVSGQLGTIRRPDGSAQVTWKGHPLYTYAGDSGAGQANGNGVSGFGGRWHAVVLSGGGSAGPSPGSGGGGYGGGY